MKRIAYICADPGVPVFGCKGASVHVQEVVRAMRRQGAQVELFTTRTDGEAAADLRYLPLRRLPVPLKGDQAMKEKAELAANDALRAALTASGTFDVIYERYSLWSYAGMAFAREQGIPGVLEVNAPLIDEQATHRGLVNRDVAEQIAARAFADARILACVSEGVAEWVRGRLCDQSEVPANGGRIPGARVGRASVLDCGSPLPLSDAPAPLKSARGLAQSKTSRRHTPFVNRADVISLHEAVTKIHVVPNAVDPQRFGPGVKARRPPTPGEFVIGFVGTLKPWHGLPVLAEAFAQVHDRASNARLLIVGDGPERDLLASTLAARGLGDAVHFTGAVNPEQIPGWLASMHVAVAPYPALENFYFSPLKLFEYLAAGLPTVASRIGQVTEFLRDGETGLLVPPGDAKALAATLDRLRADEPLRARLGANGRAFVARGHTWDAVVERLLALATH